MPDGSASAVRPLGDLCDPARGITYGIVKVGDFVPNGVPVIRGGDIRNNVIVFDDEKRVSHDISNQFSRTILRGGEIVMNLIAEPGHCALVPESMAGFNVSRDVAVMPLDDQVDRHYVNYFLKSPSAVAWLLSRLQGSVTLKINLATLRELPVPVPPIPYQRAVARVLKALDDKITVNERIVEYCDELRCLSLANFLMVEPERVGDCPLTSFAEFVNGRAFTKGATGTGRMVVRIAELNSGPSGSTVYNDMDVPDRHLARPGDVLFAWSGSLTVARWYRQEAIINQHIFKVIPRLGLPTWLAYELVLSKLVTFKGIAADKATTMGHIQRHHLDELVTAPTADAILDLDRELGPLWDRALAAEQESLVLMALRDALLPGLMSGAIRVRDAEKAVEDAT